MSDLSEDQEIRQLFVDESLEALQRCEELLLAAEKGQARADIVDVMFRDFHTIKGTSALLGFEPTAKLAHAAEDLMAKLRDQSITARRYHFARMVEVVDALRKFVEHTRDHGDEGRLDFSALTAGIRRDIELGDAAGLDSPVAAAPAPVAAPVIAPEPVPVVAAAPQPLPSPPPAPLPPVMAAPTVPTPQSEPAAPPPPVRPPEGEHGDGDKAQAQKHGADTDTTTVRVNVSLLDKLMNLMGELVLARNQMVQVVKGLEEPAAQAVAQRLSLVTSDLQEQIMKTRMQPVGRVFEKLPRMVRDLCNQTGKRVNVELEGTTTELDKALVEAIRDPLMHMVRNSMDHGFETPDVRVARGKSAVGKLLVRAAHEGSTVTIEIRDDGGGIDPARVKAVAVRRGVITQHDADRMSDREANELVFRPGFSTAEKVTAISGRGVGMDVVRTQVERAGGQVELESVLGQGTRVRLRMPLTLAIIPALMVKAGGQRLALPQSNLVELLFLDHEKAQRDIEYIRGVPVYRLRGEILPLVRLSPLLGREEEVDPTGVNIVVVAVGHRRYGLIVESISDTEEIVIKPLHGSLKRLVCFAGATVLGDGGVALILDVAGVAQTAGIDLTTRRGDARQEQAAAAITAQSVLVFSAGDRAQCAVPVSSVARLEQVDASKIETVAGAEVLQYHGEIIPIIRPETVVPIGQPPPNETGVQQLIVFNFGRPVGLAVTTILDSADVQEDALEPADLQHVLGKTVLFGRATLLLDAFGIVRQQAPSAIVDVRKVKARKPRVLLADEIDPLRASLATFLRAAGLEVVEATGEGAVRELRGGKAWDAVLAGLEYEPEQGLELVRRVRQELPGTHVVCMAREPSEQLNGQARDAGAGACVQRIEREAVLQALLSAGLVLPRPSRPS